MRNPFEYLLHAPTKFDSEVTKEIAEKLYNRVWRFDWNAPGFAVLDFEPGVESHELRTWMVELKVQLSDIALGRCGKPFLIFRWLASINKSRPNST